MPLFLFCVKSGSVDGSELYVKFLFVFVFLSWLNRYVVVLSIATLIAMKLMLPSIAFAVVYIGKEAYVLIRFTRLYISQSPDMNMRYTRGICISLFRSGLIWFNFTIPVCRSNDFSGNYTRARSRNSYG